MDKLRVGSLSVGLVVAAMMVWTGPSATRAAGGEDGKIVHSVYLKLKDNSAAAQKKLVDACRKYLTKHPGEVAYAAGPRAAEFSRDVNDKGFDLGLVIVFQDKAAHDKYQVSERHQQFIKENRDSLQGVRVFDARATAWESTPINRPQTAAPVREKTLVHSVFFSLKDNSPAAQKKLVDACQKYLTKHPGELQFAAGQRETGLAGQFNDKDFDVGLYIVFKDKAAHDKYQEDARHKQFISENRDNWKKVRVFDTDSHG